MAHDRMEIGWWIKSTDEELYGPVSRDTIWRFLEQAVITADTLVRHSMSATFAPIGDHLALRGGPAVVGGRLEARDRVAEVWPKSRQERLALSQGSMRCMRHANRLATQVCMCCMGPYCEKCRVNKGKAFYYCRKCQTRFYYARGLAYVADNVILYMLNFGLGLVLSAGLTTNAVGASVAAGIGFGVTALLWVFRDSLMRGAFLGKRAVGVRVVQVADPAAPLTHGQGFVRAVPQLIPFVNLLDLSVPYRDPLCRRWGDRWARTRVVYTRRTLEAIRAKASRLIQRNVGDCLPLEAPPQDQLVRLVG